MLDCSWITWHLLLAALPYRTRLEEEQNDSTDVSPPESTDEEGIEEIPKMAVAVDNAV
jgi:hypothetical protein